MKDQISESGEWKKDDKGLHYRIDALREEKRGEDEEKEEEKRSGTRSPPTQFAAGIRDNDFVVLAPNTHTHTDTAAK